MSKITSVALLLVSQRGEIFVVKELNEKLPYGKKYGDLSFPWETREREEADDSVLTRLIEEEIDRTMTVKMSPPACIGKFPVHNTEATAYVARYVSGPKIFIGSAVSTGEIAIAHDHDTLLVNWGWVNPGILLRHFRIRDGVQEIVNAYLQTLHQPERQGEMFV